MSEVIQEIKGTIEEMCLFPEYEYWIPVAKTVQNPVSSEYTPDLPEFEDSPAFNYRCFMTEFDANRILFRLLLTPPLRQSLPEKVVGEAIVDRTLVDVVPMILEQFTVSTLKNMEF